MKIGVYFSFTPISLAEYADPYIISDLMPIIIEKMQADGLVGQKHPEDSPIIQLNDSECVRYGCGWYFGICGYNGEDRSMLVIGQRSDVTTDSVIFNRLYRKGTFKRH